MSYKFLIFIVDDDPDDQLILRRTWQESNPAYACEVFKDGQSLMDHLNDLNKQATSEEVYLPCLILLDWNMPRKNGIEVIKELKQDPVLNKIPVVILTGSNNLDFKQHCRSLGIAECLTKPNRLDDFYALMKDIKHYCKTPP